MKLEKVIFLTLSAVGILHNPTAFIAAFMLFAYIVIHEHVTSKKEYALVKQHVDSEISKIADKLAQNEAESQKIKDSIISLKMSNGINKLTR